MKPPEWDVCSRCTHSRWTHRPNDQDFPAFKLCRAGQEGPGKCKSYQKVGPAVQQIVEQAERIYQKRATGEG